MRSDAATATTKTMSGGSDRVDAAAAAGAAQPNMRRGRVRKVCGACYKLLFAGTIARLEGMFRLPVPASVRLRATELHPPSRVVRSG